MLPLNRLRETDSPDIEIIRDLAGTDTSDWPDRYIKLFMFNHLVNRENENSLNELSKDDNVEIVAIQIKTKVRRFRFYTKMVICNICQSELEDEEKLKIHKECVHKKLIWCDDCDEYFLLESHLENHLNVVHFLRKYVKK